MSTPPVRSDRRLAHVVLCVALFVAGVVFGVRARYSRGVHDLVVGVQLTVVLVAAWRSGAWAIRSGIGERRSLATAGALLITPWALFTLLAGIGPPGMGQTAAESELRYVVLFVNAAAVAGGCVVLRDALRAAGERYFSTLGFAAILLATGLYLVWASFTIAVFGSKEFLGSAELPTWAKFLLELSDVHLFFGGALTYVASAAFSASLGRVGWLGRKSSRAFVIASLVALACLAIRGLEFPDPAQVFTQWYRIPGYVVGIPAVPWVIPCLIGLVLLWRAGAEPAHSDPAR